MVIFVWPFYILGKYVVCRTRGLNKGCGSCGTPQKCIFPFIYNGREYSGCARSVKGVRFCATKVDSKKKLTKVGLCNNYCGKDIYGNC